MSWLTTAARTWLTGSAAPFMFTDENDETLDYQGISPLGLYVHIPFCRSLCNFCPYCKEIYRPDTAAAYGDALIEEIRLVTARQREPRPVSSLYFGGGTPALMASQLGSIIAELRRHFLIQDGIGLELHPSDVRPEILRQLRDAGITRISIGIQSFLPDLARVLGRPAPSPQKLADALREVPFETVSMDFIFALPGQNAAQVIQDVETAFSHGANHVAIYPFIDFSFTSSSVPAAQKSLKREMMDTIAAHCSHHGYDRDSIWTFALPGGHRYSSMTRDCYLGFGCSAVTLLRDSFKINTFSVAAYRERVRRGLLPSCLTTRFSTRQRMVYYLFWRAYSMHISDADFSTFFGVPLREAFGAELWLACRLGLLERETGGYRLTTRGAFYFHHYENFYTLAYIDKMWGILRREPFPESLHI